MQPNNHRHSQSKEHEFNDLENGRPGPEHLQHFSERGISFRLVFKFLWSDWIHRQDHFQFRNESQSKLWLQYYDEQQKSQPTKESVDWRRDGRWNNSGI